MEIISYNSELAIANLMFMRIFSNIKIGKVLSNGQKKLQNVNIVLGNRSRILKNIQNPEKKGTYKLPLIVVKRTGYVRSPDRLNDLHNEVKYEISSSKREYNLLTPLPVDIQYELTIITKNVSDADQIASNFMIFFNSGVFCSCEHPKYFGIKMNNQIVMDDSVSEEHNDEIDSSIDDIITTTFNFTFKTYLFGGTQKTNISSLTRKCSKSDCACNNDGVCICTGDCATCKKGSNCSDPEAIDTTNSCNDPENRGPDTTYDGFVPIINKIKLGYYAIPRKEEFIKEMDKIDSYELSSRWMHKDRQDIPRELEYNEDKCSICNINHVMCWKIDESW